MIGNQCVKSAARRGIIMSPGQQPRGRKDRVMRRNNILAFILAFACLALSGLNAAKAQCILPYQLTNGQVADATQVMANFNALLNCATVSSGTAGQVGYYATTGTTISGEGLSALIDSAIGSTRGAIVERGSSGWTTIVPGAAGSVLTSNGSGADPSYQAGGGGGGLAPLFNISAGVPALSGFTQVGSSGIAGTDQSPKALLFNVTVGSSDVYGGYYIAVPSTPYRVAICLMQNQLFNQVNSINFIAGTTPGRTRDMSSHSAPVRFESIK